MEKYKEKKVGYKVARFFLKPLYLLRYKPKVINSNVIPENGPIILCGNHKHVMDQCNVLCYTKRVVHYMAKKEYFDGKFAWFFKMVGCISVNRSIHDEEAKAKAIDILNHGGAIGIFPEGTRNKTNDFLLPFKFGAVSMAQKTNATIVPFGITGSYEKHSKDLMVRFGKPFKVNNMSLEEANEHLKESISSLMKENLKLSDK